MEGLTFQGKLEDFWSNQYEIDQDLNRKFRQYLIENNQINGNFYQRIPGFNNHSGIDLEQFNKIINLPAKKPVVTDGPPTVALNNQFGH